MSQTDFKLMQIISKIEYDDYAWKRIQEGGSIHWSSQDCTIECKYEDPKDGWLARTSVNHYWEPTGFVPELEKLYQEAIHED